MVDSIYSAAHHPIRHTYPNNHSFNQSMEKQEVKSWLNREEFYSLMRAYRHAPASNQVDVVAAFEAVKAAIMEEHESQVYYIKFENEV